MTESVPTRLAQGTSLGADFRALGDAMPQLVWTARPDGALEYLNRRWIEYTGLTLELLSERGSDVGVVHPDDLGETWTRWKAALATATPYEMEYRLRCAADESYRWFLSRAMPVFDDDGSVIRWIGTATDIDEQRRARDGLAFIVQASHIFSSAPDVDTICRVLADLTIGHFADWCFVALSNDGQIRTAAMAHKDRELVRYLEQFRGRYPTRPDDPIARVIAENAPMLVERVFPEQIADAARDDQHLELLKLLRMHSVMLVPLATPAGNVHGAIALVAAESGRTFNKVDIDVARSVCERAAIAIENAETLATERLTSQRLRFTGRANEVLLETADFWQAMRHIAEIIASDVADGCTVMRVAGHTARVEIAVAREPAVNANVKRLEGKRPLRPDGERTFVARLESSSRSQGLPLLPNDAWPHLQKEFAALNPESAVVFPLRSGETTHGALIATYSQRPYREELDLPLLEEVAARASIVAGQAEILERERRIATTLQQASLPSLIPQPAGMHLDAVYSPASDEAEVGGDWYDAIELDDGSVVVSVGDVTGRGIQAAAIMSKVRHAMGMAPRHEPDPRKILDSAEWFLRKRYPDAIVTAFVGIVSADRKTLRFANAGHPFPLLRRASGELLELAATGLPLGLRHLASEEGTRQVELCEGDLLTLYTDGLTEWNHDWEDGQRCLESILRTRAIVASTAAAHLIAKHCLPDKPRDDVAILTVSVGTAPSWSFAVEDPRAAADARQTFVDFLRSRLDDEQRILRGELIFGELLGNVVRYAPGPVEIHLYDDADGGMRLHVIDSGPVFDVSNRLPNDSFSELGRGLFIVQHIGRRLTVERVPNGGNHTSIDF